MGPTLKLELPADRRKGFRTLNEQSYVGTEWLAASAQTSLAGFASVIDHFGTMTDRRIEFIFRVGECNSLSLFTSLLVTEQPV